ncbi:MAG: sensor histidine kinase [Bacillota bacterium]
MLTIWIVIPDALVQTYLIFALFGIEWKSYKRQSFWFILIFVLFSLLLFKLHFPFELRILLNIFFHTLLMKMFYPFSWRVTFLISIIRTSIQTIMFFFTIDIFQYSIKDLYIAWTVDSALLALGIFLSVKKLAIFKWFTEQHKEYKKYLIVITALFLFHDELINLLMIRAIDNPQTTGRDVLIVALITDMFMAVIIYIIITFGKRLEQQTLDTTEKVYLHNLEDFIASVRAHRHDYSNHLQVIAGLIHREEYEDVKQYLKDLNQELRGHEFLVQLDHPPLAALLQTKVEIAHLEHIDIKVDAYTTIPPLEIKSYEMVQIVGNLLDNAIEEELKAPVPVRFITVTLNRMLDSMLIIRVHNVNSWIPQENLGNIFDKGYTTKESHQGIGLATVKRLVTKYRGHIDVESRQAFGTMFVVFIPL